MNINEIIKNKGYETDTVRICKFLGFTDTEQLKEARFFSQEQSYTPIPYVGISISNFNYTWRLCKIVDGDNKLHTIDYGYKFLLEICDGSGYGKHLYYQSDFYLCLKMDLLFMPRMRIVILNTSNGQKN